MSSFRNFSTFGSFEAPNLILPFENVDLETVTSDYPIIGSFFRFFEVNDANCIHTDATMSVVNKRQASTSSFVKICCGAGEITHFFLESCWLDHFAVGTH